MLWKIIRLKNVGLFADGVPSRPVELDAATIVYAENGRGKSTLASIFRACSLGDHARITARKTIDSDGDPEIQFLIKRSTDNITVAHSGTGWSTNYPEIMVFDSEFVDQNVYSGFEVRSEQRTALLEFALGDDAVTQKKKVNDINTQSDEVGRRKNQIEKELARYIAPFDMLTFIALEEDLYIEAKIKAIQTQIDTAKRMDAILSLQLPTPISLVTVDWPETCNILSKQLDDLATDAEEQVEVHLSSHSASTFEDWISTGQAFMHDENCPFCGQSTVGLSLIAAYRAYFSQEYNALKDTIERLAQSTDKALGESWMRTLETELARNQERLTNWGEHVTLVSPVVDLASVKEKIGRVYRELMDLIRQKSEQPFEIAGSPICYQEMEETISAINQELRAYNYQIEVAKEKITEFKASLSSEEQSKLQAKLKQLITHHKRFSPDIEQLVTDYNECVAEYQQLQGAKQTAKAELDDLMENTLDRYQERVNELIRSFHADFEIQKLTHDYRARGNPRSSYHLRIRNHLVNLNTRPDALGRHSFGTVLSEADKRTLAFAFFLAKLEEDPNLQNRIVVFDDPVSSLDVNRRRETIARIVDFAARCRQVIVLSHDAYFVRDLRDKLANSYACPLDPTLIKIQRSSNNYSQFAACDIDTVCASTYYRHYQLVSDYIAGGNPDVDSRTVAKAIRPLLEGYLHRRFPGKVPRNRMFGAIIAQIAAVESPDPLVYVKPLLAELRRINDYASDFHHDTNPDADTIPINETSLYNFARDALELIHKNG